MNTRNGRTLRSTMCIGIISAVAIVAAACGSSSGGSADAATTSASGAATSDTGSATAPAENPSSSESTSHSDAESAPASSQNVAKIKVGIGSNTASYTALYVCEDQGVFQKHGLDVELQALKTSAQLLAAVMSGSIQIGGGVGTALMAGALQDEPVKVIAMDVPVYGLAIWGNSAIPDLDGLVGKKVSVGAPGSLSSTAMDQALADHGLTGKIEVVNLADAAAGAAALAQGAVDAVVSAPDRLFSAVEAGEDVHLIFDFTQYRTAGQVYGVAQSYIDSDSETIQKYVDSLAECLTMAHSDKDSTVQSLMKHTGITNATTADETYNFWNKVWSQTPAVDPALVKDALDSVAAKTGVTPPEDASKFIDATFTANYAG